jgi:hypothetical protein
MRLSELLLCVKPCSAASYAGCQTYAAWRISSASAYKLSTNCLGFWQTVMYAAANRALVVNTHMCVQ